MTGAVVEDGKSVCAWCRKEFDRNPMKANHECCSAKCRSARWRSKQARSTKLNGIEQRLTRLERRVYALESLSGRVQSYFETEEER